MLSDRARSCEFIRMITSFGRQRHKVSLLALSLMIIISGRVASTWAQLAERLQDYEQQQWQWRQAQLEKAEKRTAIDKDERGVAETDDFRWLREAEPRPQLGLAEFCLRNPAECDLLDRLSLSGCVEQDGAPGLDQSGTLCETRRAGTREPGNGQRVSRRDAGESLSLASNRIADIVESLYLRLRNSTTIARRAEKDLDVGDGAGFWPEPIGAPQPDSNRNARLATSAPVQVAKPPGAVSHGRERRLSTRSWRQPTAQAIRPNTYWLSLEDARRLVRAQRQEQQSFEIGERSMAPESYAPADPLDYLERALRAKLSAKNSASAHTTRRQRSELGSAKRPELAPGRLFDESHESSLAAAAATTTSGRQLLRESESQEHKTTTTTTTTTTSMSVNGGDGAGGNQEGSDPDAMKCNRKLYTYTATKSDGRGNSCSGKITASICYGACDTGEIADWLFPHKKSIHKVCRHGARQRRRQRLDNCQLATGDMDESLREYHYVDALDCVCKKCTSVDTTCLGSMTRPHLPGLEDMPASSQELSGDGGGGGAD